MAADLGLSYGTRPCIREEARTARNIYGVAVGCQACTFQLLQDETGLLTGCRVEQIERER